MKKRRPVESGATEGDITCRTHRLATHLRVAANQLEHMRSRVTVESDLLRFGRSVWCEELGVMCCCCGCGSGGWCGGRTGGRHTMHEQDQERTQVIYERGEER